jgi:hypothetical protein
VPHSSLITPLARRRGSGSPINSLRLARSLEKPLSFDRTYPPRRYIEEPQLEKERESEDVKRDRRQGEGRFSTARVSPSRHRLSLRIPSDVSDSDGMTNRRYSSYDFRNSKISALIVAASVVGMPWGKPL